MKNDRVQQRFFRGAYILTAAGILGKILSAAYRIPLQNITGDLGFYVYQQVYPFLGTAMILALYGFPAAISKLVAERTPGEEANDQATLYMAIIRLLSVFSIAIAGLIYFSAPLIANQMNDLQLVASIRASAGVFLLIPFVASLRGFFQGKGNMVPTAISQVVEQLLRVCFIILTAWFVAVRGWSIYSIGIGASAAAIMGAIGATAVLGLFWIKQRRVKPVLQVTLTYRYLLVPIFGYGLVLTINHLLLLLFQFVDAFTLVPGLVGYGYSTMEAQAWKGVFDRGQPLVQLGIVAGASLALALLPSITKERLQNNTDQFVSHIRSTWKFSLYLSAGATVGLITIFPQVNVLLFKVDIGTTSLRIFSLTIVFASLSIVTATILQGLGHFYRTAIFVVIGVGVKVVLNSLLIPLYGIKGPAYATVISTVVVFFLNVNQMKRLLPTQKLIDIPWIRFFGALGGMVATLLTLNQLFNPILTEASRSGYAGYVSFVIIMGMSVYLLLLVRFRAFTKNELQVLPFNQLLLTIMKERNKDE